MRHCVIHRVQHLNMRRAADAAAEWVNNDLRGAEVDDADEARIQRDHLVLGDVGGDRTGRPGSSGHSAPECHCWHQPDSSSDRQPLRGA